VKGQAGFCWQDLGDERVLVRIEGVPFESYDPLMANNRASGRRRGREYDAGDTGLFRTFAALEPTEEAILGFAQRYGSLAGSGGMVPLAIWRDSINHIKTLVSTWDALTARDWNKLREMKLSRNFFSNRTSMYRQGSEDLAVAAIRSLYFWIVRELREWMGAIIWDPDKGGGVISPLVSWSADMGTATMTFKIWSLLEAITFQFGLAILGNKAYQPCAACGRWFELSPGVNRDDRLVCSVSCRVKLYRQRRRARQLHQEGRPIKEIAKKLGSEVSTVKQWLAQNKE